MFTAALMDMSSLSGAKSRHEGLQTGTGSSSAVVLSIARRDAGWVFGLARELTFWIP